jgi:hypothetical protein
MCVCEYAFGSSPAAGPPSECLCVRVYLLCGEAVARPRACVYPRAFVCVDVYDMREGAREGHEGPGGAGGWGGVSIRAGVRACVSAEGGEAVWVALYVER